MSSFLNNPSTIQDEFPVAVLMSFHSTQVNPWSDGQWEATGLVVGKNLANQKLSTQAINADTKNTEYLCSGFSVELYKDQVQSYYDNIMSDNPKVFIVCHDLMDDNEANLNSVCQPFLVTLSFDEAISHMEVDELVFSVNMPPELYLWLEHFVMEHYAPEKKKKRRRNNWKEASNP